MRVGILAVVLDIATVTSLAAPLDYLRRSLARKLVAVMVLISGFLLPLHIWELTANEAQALDQSLLLRAIGFGAAALLVGLFVTLIIARSVTRRIENLASVSERFRGGERNVRALVRGRDEVAQAALGINGMLEAVIQSEQSLKEVQRIAGLASWRYDPDLSRLDWQPEAAEMFGFSDTAAAPAFEEFLGSLRPDDGAALRQVADDPAHDVSSLTVTVVRAQRGERTCWLHLRSERKPGGGRILVATCQDVTDREAAAAQLRQAQKMEAVGQLTGGIAHDFNNLLAIVIGNLDIANEELAEGSLAKEAIEEALEAVLRGSTLTKQLLAFSRRQPLAARSLDLNGLIRGFEPLLRRTVGAGIELRTVLAERLPAAKVDPAQMETAILNLVINARDAMPDGGAVTLETDMVDVDDAADTAFEDIGVGSYCVVTVSDTGHGMTPETKARACEPFFTTKAVGAGSGLGLSMIYGFARQSGGHLRIYSEIDRGTAVRLYLPVSDVPAEAAAGPRDRAMPKAAEEIVLVVEDDAHVRRVVARQLAELGYEVLCAEHAAEALEILETQPVDLLFTDIVMPGGFGGLELGRRARAAYPELRILYTSGFTRSGTVGLEPDAALLTKPYRKTDLARCLRSILDAPQLEPAGADA